MTLDLLSLFKLRGPTRRDAMLPSLFLHTLYNTFDDHLLIWPLIVGLIDQYNHKEMINEHVL